MSSEKSKSIDNNLKIPSSRMTTRKSSQALVNKGETSEKEMDTFALLRQDIKDVKDRLDKMVKSDDLEILVTSIVMTLLDGNKFIIFLSVTLFGRHIG